MITINDHYSDILIINGNVIIELFYFLEIFSKIPPR